MGKPFQNADLSTGVNISVQLTVDMNRYYHIPSYRYNPPINNPISNSALTTYRYIVDPDQSPITTSNQSNTTTTQINSAILTAQKFKCVNSRYWARLSSTPLQLQIAEMLMQRMLFLPTLFQTELPLNQIVLHLMELLLENANTITGVPIGDIAPNESAIVEFHITSNEIPAINPITNQASVSFQHIVNPDNPPVSKKHYFK